LAAGIPIIGTIHGESALYILEMPKQVLHEIQVIIKNLSQ